MGDYNVIEITTNLLSTNAYGDGSATTTTKLATPQLTKIREVNATTIAVSYSAVPNASGYKIEYATDMNFTQNVGSVLAGANTLAKNVPLPYPFAGYYIRVMANGNGTYGNSDYSNVLIQLPLIYPDLSTELR